MAYLEYLTKLRMESVLKVRSGIFNRFLKLIHLSQGRDDPFFFRYPVISAA
jgi:hypothetical protein